MPGGTVRRGLWSPAVIGAEGGGGRACCRFLRFAIGSVCRVGADHAAEEAESLFEGFDALSPDELDEELSDELDDESDDELDDESEDEPEESEDEPEESLELDDDLFELDPFRLSFL
jgi:hypothetical protein